MTCLSTLFTNIYNSYSLLLILFICIYHLFSHSSFFLTIILEKAGKPFSCYHKSLFIKGSWIYSPVFLSLNYGELFVRLFFFPMCSISSKAKCYLVSKTLKINISGREILHTFFLSVGEAYLAVFKGLILVLPSGITPNAIQGTVYYVRELDLVMCLYDLGWCCYYRLALCIILGLSSNHICLPLNIFVTVRFLFPKPFVHNKAKFWVLAQTW